MAARKIVFFGNCQCLYLYKLYRGQIQPVTGDDVVYIDSQRYRPSNEISAAHLASADILVDQIFDVPDAITGEELKPGVRRIRVPNLRGDFLWPYGSRDVHPLHRAFHRRTTFFYSGEYGDSFLARMVIKKVPAEIAVQRYLDADLIKERNIDRIFELSFDRQKRRDALAGVNTADFIAAWFREERLFESPGHPTETLLALLARAALTPIVGEAEVERALAGHSEAFETCHRCPVHPGVIRHYGLKYIHEYSRYGMNSEGAFTFPEYALRYMQGESIPELHEALEAAGQDDASRALALMDRALPRAERSAAAHRVRASLLRKLGRFGEALDSAWRGVSLVPDDPNNFIELIRSAQAAGQSTLAEQIGRTALDLFPRNAHVVLALAGVLVAVRRHEEGIVLIQHAVDMLPSFAGAVAELGRLHVLIGDYTKGELLAKRAIELEPGLVQAQAVLSDALHKQGRSSEAIGSLRSVLAEGVAKPEIYVPLANAMINDGDAAGAEELLRNATSVAGHPDIRAALALAIERQGRRTEAIAILEKVLEETPNNPHLLARLGNWLMQDGQLAAAEKALRRATELDLSPGFRTGLSEALARQGRLAEAIAVVRDVTSRGSDDPELFGRLGHLLWQQSDFAGAETAFRRAAELMPPPRFRLSLADCIEKQGRLAEAIAVLRDVAETCDDPQAFTRLGHLLLREDAGAAEAAFRRAAKRDRTPAPRLGLAESLARQGQPQEAIATLRELAEEGHDDSRIYARLGDLLLNLKEFAAAQEALRHAIRISPDPSYRASLERAAAAE